ncbi:MAG: TraR/DksA C4-type zinc finger protein [candidate division WWE3 bacterium]|nr:TraR/DksA C4-type zinc finger protein [candidate division WWE3 bacterium]
MAKKQEVPKSFLASIRNILSSQEKRVAREKDRLAKESLAARPEIGSIRSPEFVEEATEGMSQERLEAERGILEKLLMETRLALSKIKIGKYGICENCAQPIDRPRLKVYPQARHCLDCEKKLSLKKGA